MERKEDRRRRPPPALLRQAAQPLQVLAREQFDAVLVGWIDAASRGLLEVSVVLFEVVSPAAADALAEQLRTNLRSVDVIGRYESTAVAAILDADGPGVARCLERVRRIAHQSGIDVEESVWTGPPRS